MGLATVENLLKLEKALLSNEGDRHALEQAHQQLQALLAVKISAYESLVVLQQGYVDHVEPGEVVALDDLTKLRNKLDKFRVLHARNENLEHESG
jgi:hypothetical protein